MSATFNKFSSNPVINVFVPTLRVGPSSSISGLLFPFFVARTLHDAVVIVAFGPNKESLSPFLVRLRHEDLWQADKMIGVPLSHPNTIDLFRIRRSGVPKSPGQITSEQLIVPAIYKNHFAIW